MIDVLNINAFLVKQQYGLIKAGTAYDIFEPQTGQKILECREDNLGLGTKALRFTKHKKRTGFDVKIKLPDGPMILRLTRSFSIMLSDVTLRGEDGTAIGHFKVDLSAKLTKSLEVRDASGQPIAYLQGTGLGWSFQYVCRNRVWAQINRITKGTKMWTSADDYIIQIHPTIPPNAPERAFILASAICADMVFNQ